MSKEKFALVTGCSKGLGLEIAYYLLDQGYIVFGASRTPAPIEDDNFFDYRCDLRDESSVIEMVGEIREITESLQLIVLNAGVGSVGTIDEIESEDMFDTFETNVFGVFYLMKHIKPYLESEVTHIISLSSLLSEKGIARFSSYSASKSALETMLESLREEWKGMGIRFSTLLPGPMDTDHWDETMGKLSRDVIMSMDDVIHVFSMVESAPSYMEFPEISFLHKGVANR